MKSLEDQTSTHSNPDNDSPIPAKDRSGGQLVWGLVLGLALWCATFLVQIWLWDLVGAIASGLAAGSAAWLVIAFYIAPHADDSRGAAFFRRLGGGHEAVADATEAVRDGAVKFSRGVPILSGVVGGFTLSSLILGPYVPDAPSAVPFKVVGALAGLLLAICVVGVLDEAAAPADDSGEVEPVS